MDIYTISLSQWRKAKQRDIPLFDITVKSGDRLFAPAEAVLWAYKRGEVSDEEYTRLYFEKLMVSFREHPEAFEALLSRDQPLAVACYCTAGKFCHRHLFVEFMMDVADDNGYSINVCGEIL